ncbi:MAG: hypothetical protein GY804_04190 [Alphaproteobacteria bacterium]|nr:hypothetical protein [Alphaproteobacteria bacterium]
MAIFNKFECFVRDLGNGYHDLTNHTFKIYLSNTAPNAGTMEVKADLAEITAQNGYPAGGTDVQNTWVEVSGTATLDGTNIVFTASGGSFGPFRYLVVVNDTQTTPLKPLCSWYDYGSSVSVNDGETLTYNILTNIFSLA